MCKTNTVQSGFGFEKGEFDEYSLPPLAPMTATLLFLALEVEKLLAMVAKGRWNLDIILDSLTVKIQTFKFDTQDLRIFGKYGDQHISRVIKLAK